MTAHIINIGDELLIGQVVNTNAAWMAEELNKINVAVERVSAVADKGEAIDRELRLSLTRADLILLTGGLGPTKDDITKQVLARTFNSRLVTHDETLRRVIDYFRRREIPMPEVNRDQALVLEGCDVVVNEVGTAPCMVINHEGKTIISLPGVPFEMKWLMQNRILPLINHLTGGEAIVHRTIGVFGIPESLLAEQISDWENALPRFIRLAYLPKAGIVRLRLSAYGPCHDELVRAVDEQTAKLHNLIGHAIFTEQGEELSEALGRIMRERETTVATAESCTAGLIASRIVETPGASEYLKGGIVAYTDEIKERVLGVEKEIIDAHTAVSAETAAAMARGALKMFNSDWAVSTTGYSGPDGGTEHDPRGTVYITVTGRNGFSHTERYVFATTREQHRERSANQALFSLYSIIRNN